MLIKVGRFQVWVERTRFMSWRPHIEKCNDSTLFWFLNLHLIWDHEKEEIATT